jgi:hypothetical protein
VTGIHQRQEVSSSPDSRASRFACSGPPARERRIGDRDMGIYLIDEWSKL